MWDGLSAGSSSSDGVRTGGGKKFRSSWCEASGRWSVVWTCLRVSAGRGQPTTESTNVYSDSQKHAKGLLSRVEALMNELRRQGSKARCVAVGHARCDLLPVNPADDDAPLPYSRRGLDEIDCQKPRRRVDSPCFRGAGAAGRRK